MFITAGKLLGGMRGTGGNAPTSKYIFTGTNLRTPDSTKTLGANAYFCCQSAFYTGDDALTNVYFVFCPWWTQGTGAETATSVISLDGLGIKIGAGSWAAVPNSAVASFDASAKDCYILGPVASIPANTLCYLRVSGAGANGNTIPISSAPKWKAISPAEAGDVSASSLAAKLTDGTAMADNGSFTGLMKPFCIVGQATTTRTSILAIGDSIGWGKNGYISGDTTSSVLTPRGDWGYISIGMDDKTSSKRIPCLNTCIAGSAPASLAQDLRRWRTMDAIKLLVGNYPFDEILCQHGTNAGATVVTDLVSLYTYLAGRFTGKSISQVELLPRPSSTDMYQTLANQTCATQDAYPGGARWQANAAAGGTAGTMGGDPSATWRVAGYIISSIPMWLGGCYDTGSNRGFLKVNLWSSTLAADYPGGVQNISSVDTPASAGLGLGDNIDFNGIWDAYTLSITGSGPYTINLGNNGTAEPTGTAIASMIHDRTGLHPGPNSHRYLYAPLIVSWKQYRGWV